MGTIMFRLIYKTRLRKPRKRSRLLAAVIRLLYKIMLMAKAYWLMGELVSLQILTMLILKLKKRSRRFLTAWIIRSDYRVCRGFVVRLFFEQA